MIWILLDTLVAFAYDRLCTRRRRYWRWLDALQATTWARRYHAEHK